MNRNLIKTAGITVMTLLVSFFLTSTLLAGSEGLTYQWYKDGKAIPGATSDSYTIPSITESDFGEYTVVVANEYGETTSYPGYLTKEEDSEGGLPLYYQWYKDGIPINGATGTSYTIDPVTLADEGSYHVIVSNDFGSVTSDDAVLTVESPESTPLIITLNDSKVYDGTVLVSSYANATVTGLRDGDYLTGGTFTSASANVGSYSYPNGVTITTPFETAMGISNYTVTYIANLTINSVPDGNATINMITKNPVIYGSSCGNLYGIKTGNEITGALLYNGQVIARQPFALSAKGVGTGLLKGELITTDMVPAGQVVTLQLVAYDQGYLDHRKSGDYYYGISVPFEYKTGNSEDSAVIADAQLVFDAFTVEYTPVETENVVIRSYIAKSMNSAEVTLQVTPKADVSVYFVEEQLPAGQNYTISNISNSGKYIENRNMIRWSFLDGIPRNISYVLTVPENYSGTISLNGEVTFDETTVPIMGIREITFPFLPQTHPADMDDDFEISTKEVSSYALAWTKGQNWSREPQDIPVLYVSRAALIWINGGYYTYDDSKSEPACWVSTAVKPASVTLAAASTNERKINVSNGKANVALEIIPSGEISVYFVEEQLPEGITLSVKNISDGGNYIAEKNVIRWSFLDAEPRTLTYILEPETGFQGSFTLSGEVTFDDETFITEGDTEANFRPTINFDVEADGKTLVLEFVGTLYESDDTVNWKAVEGAQSPYRVDITHGKKFYRCANGLKSNGEGKNFTIQLSSSVNLDMVWIEPGTFIMGSPEDELGRWNDEIQQEVTLTKGYWMGKYEVTQAQYEVVTGYNPAVLGYGVGDNYPVYRITEYSAMWFCEDLTAYERAAGRLPEGYEYTLPTEAQWEYACRAGTTTAFNNGTNIPTEEQCRNEPCPNLDSIAWYSRNSGGKVHEVGHKLPNAWGLYDMHGNVEEWCLWYPGEEYLPRVICGGSCSNTADLCRSASRNYVDPNGYVPTDRGFRVALVPVP